MKKSTKLAILVGVGVVAIASLYAYMQNQKKAKEAEDLKDKALAAADTANAGSTTGQVATPEKPWTATPTITAAGAGVAADADWSDKLS